MQAPHNRGLDEAHRSVNIMILDSRDQNLFTFLQKVLLDGPNVLDVADILVELWIDCHVLRSHSKPLSMLILVLNIKHKGYASWILAHHFL